MWGSPQVWGVGGQNLGSRVSSARKLCDRVSLAASLGPGFFVDKMEVMVGRPFLQNYCEDKVRVQVSESDWAGGREAPHVPHPITFCSA